MPMKKLSSISSVAFSVVFLMVIAACGGSSDEGSSEGKKAAKQEITVNWGAEPPSLDPGLATDTTSANILFNIMDPLVKLDKNLDPTPSLAESSWLAVTGSPVFWRISSNSWMRVPGAGMDPGPPR